ncbi:MAG: hypothetical protein LBI39_02705 [Puniceicoccales bacterium]|jgi:hypothetical protein|nr:hypothetical protein [Puniceicoccales bacterium]
MSYFNLRDKSGRIYITLTEGAVGDLGNAPNRKIAKKCVRWAVFTHQGDVRHLNGVHTHLRTDAIKVIYAKKIEPSAPLYALNVFFSTTLRPGTIPVVYDAIVERVIAISAAGFAPAPQPVALQPTIAPRQVGAAQMPQRPATDPSGQRREMALHHQWALDGLQHRP